MHFLTGHQYVPIIDSTDQGNVDLVTRYEKLQLKFHEICARYKLEYLTRQQSRSKWLNTSKNMEIGQLVLVKEENLATTKWPLARIIDIHKGADGLVRVVTLRTADGIQVIRPIAKLSPLPMEKAPQEDLVPLIISPRRSPRLANKPI